VIAQGLDTIFCVCRDALQKMSLDANERIGPLFAANLHNRFLLVLPESSSVGEIR